MYISHLGILAFYASYGPAFISKSHFRMRKNLAHLLLRDCLLATSLRKNGEILSFRILARRPTSQRIISSIRDFVSKSALAIDRYESSVSSFLTFIFRITNVDNFSVI
ncbi:hypothetical protein PUN28_004686 [Cardiocondyla obscurior]|uniref:Uncharacterized protein n=1 Tax=Cardiocondyla obscurior TaxID=286306 RepID=A0AAW2GES1_9HYME